jgi:multicomponent Na+:H+ antiporter subunit F
MIEYVIFLLVVAVFIIFFRVARGPTLPDRVLAFDTINSIVIGIIVLISLYYANEMFVDIGIVYAILSFLGTLAVSKYLLGKEMHK